MNKYIIQKLAIEHKLSNKHIEEILDGFYRGLKYYLENADESKGGIIISKYFKFYIDFHREMKAIERGLTNETKPRMEVFRNLNKYRSKKVKLSKRDYERQKKITSYDEQRN